MTPEGEEDGSEEEEEFPRERSRGNPPAGRGGGAGDVVGRPEGFEDGRGGGLARRRADSGRLGGDALTGGVAVVFGATGII